MSRASAMTDPATPRRPDPARDWWAAVLSAAGAGLLGLLPLPWCAVGAITAGVGMWLRPWMAIPVVVLALPYHAHPKSLGGLEVAISEALILLSFGVAAIRVLSERAVPRPTTLGTPGVQPLRPAVVDGPRRPALQGGTPSPEVQPLRPAAVDWLVALFVLAGLLSLLVTEYPKQSLRELRWLVVEPVLLCYLARATVFSAGQIVVIVASLAVSGAAAGLVSVAALAVDGTFFDLGTRGMAPFPSPNHLGLFLGRALSASLALLLFVAGATPGQQRIRWLSGLTTSTIALGIIRSVSLGAWASLAAVALTLAGLRSRRLALAAAAGVGALAIGALVLLPTERTVARFDPAVGTGLSRLQVWQATTRMIADHPVLGLGLDNFLYAYRSEYMSPEAWREPNLSHPHNWVLHLWVQLGVPGLAAAIGLGVWTAVAALRLFRRPRAAADRPLAACVGGMLLSFLVHGSLDNSYFLPDAAALWWLGIGLMCTRAQGHSMSPERDTTGTEDDVSPRSRG